jgi:2-polyprenyl-3-methyl-5-hydroxy-6-metoxy-1,4-benzoquinol methylase
MADTCVPSAGTIFHRAWSGPVRGIMKLATRPKPIRRLIRGQHWLLEEQWVQKEQLRAEIEANYRKQLERQRADLEARQWAEAQRQQAEMERQQTEMERQRTEAARQIAELTAREQEVSERFRQFAEGEDQRFTERLYREYPLANPQNILSSPSWEEYHAFRSRRPTSMFLFVVGSGSSGTTIMLRVLSEHPDVYAIPGETSLFGGKSDVHVLEQLLFWEQSAQRVDKSVVLEKTPNHVFYFNRINEFLPNCRIICMVRDPRDVVASLIRRGHTFEESVESVKLYQRQIDELRRKCANHLVVRLEDLTDNPNTTVSNVLDFAGMRKSSEIVDEMLHYHCRPKTFYTDKIELPENNVGGNVPRMRDYQINQPLKNDKLRWMTEIPAEKHAEMFDRLAIWLQEYGYFPIPSDEPNDDLPTVSRNEIKNRVSAAVALSPLEDAVYNQGERLILERTHDDAERDRHKSSYRFFRKIIDSDLLRGTAAPPITILDIGSGCGHGTYELARISGAKVTGVDIQPECLEYARAYYDAENIRYELIEDIFDYARSMPPFDYIVSRHVFEHIPDAFRLVQDLQWTKRLLINVPFAERAGNPFHLLLNIRESDFPPVKQREFFYEDLSGETYLSPPEGVIINSICCCYSNDPPDIASSSGIEFPVSRWMPRGEHAVIREVYDRLVHSLAKV